MAPGTEPMSAVDAAWLRMEHRTNLMLITSVMTFTEGIDFNRLKAVIEDRVLYYDRFRQRVVESRLPFGRPRWEDDEHFNLGAHLFHSALPAPGGKAELERMVSSLMSTPLDYTKPLWQFHVIDNCMGGSAVVAKLHHCIADGIALVKVMLGITDPSADANDVYRPMPERTRASAPNTWLPEVLGSAVGSAVKLTESVADQAREALEDPSRAAQLARGGASVAEALTKLLTMPPDPDTVFRGRLGTAKRAAWSEILPLQAVRSHSKRVGATINDVLLTGVCGALRRYVQIRGGLTAGLNIRAVVPVNLRPEDEEGTLGNRFGLVYLSLPVGIADVGERLAELKRRMDEIKGSTEAVVAYAILGALGMATPEVESMAVSLLGNKATAVMTNVPGPRGTIYLAGSPLTSMMFWVPQSGRLGLGVSILSYAGQVRLGVATDCGLVPDPGTIVDAFQDEMEAMLG